MTESTRRGALLAGLGGAGALICPLTAAALTASAPFAFRLTQNRVWLSVKVNGRGPYAFLIDTAARDYMIDQKLAADLKLTGGDSTLVQAPGQMNGGSKAARMKGPVGFDDLPVFQADRVEVGGAFLEREAVLVGQPTGRFDLAQGVVPSGRVAVWDMNFDKSLARVSGPVPENATGYELVPLLKTDGVGFSHMHSGHRPLMHGWLDGRSVKVLFDTGIGDALFVSPRFVKAHRLWDSHARAQPGRTWTTFGRVPRTRTVIGERFQIGKLVFDKPPVVLGDPGDADEATHEADVLVGVEMLRRLNFIYDLSRQQTLIRASAAHKDFWRIDRSGLELEAQGDFVHVASVQKGSPAEAADFRPGDTVKGWIGQGGYFGILWALQDEPGRSIHFQLERDGKELMKPVTLDDWL